MLSFDPADPFPLISLELVSYADQQAHAALVDEWLGLQTDFVESSLSKSFDAEAAKARDERYWIGLSVQSLLTPYVELRFLLSELGLGSNLPSGEPPNSFSTSIVDLGAGYGRMGFVLARHFPHVKFLGIEVVSARVSEGTARLERYLKTLSRPLDAASVRLFEGDLTSANFVLPEADIYFLYDYGSASAIEKTLVDLRERALRRPITVIGRGGASRDAIERRHPWLSGVQSPKHFPHFSIYRS